MADEVSIKFWLNKLWGVNNQHRRMLVWDSFRGHLTESVKCQVRTVHNTDLCVIPGGCTSKLQPADVSWNRPFKSKLAEMYDEWMFNGPVDKTKFGNSRPPSKAPLLRWIKHAWDSISPDMIRKSCKKCGITCALDGTEDDLFQISDSEEDAAGAAADEFEGFSQAELDITNEIYQNVECVLSEESCGSDSDDVECIDTDYYSPGH